MRREMNAGSAGPSQPIRRVLVVGGGIVAWSAAAAFKRRLPWLDLAILPHPVAANALADTMVPTLPSILGFHADLGISDADAVVRTGSGLRLGTLFSGWAAAPGDYVHAYGAHGKPFGATSFHLQWTRLAAAGVAAPFDRHAPAAALARAGRLAPAGATLDGLFDDHDSGLQLDLVKYRAMLQAFAQHCGVRVHAGGFAAVERRTDGFIDHVALDDGTTHAADLFVDATGPEAVLCNPDDGAWEDWSHSLLCDRVLHVEGPAAATMALHDTVTATAAGWAWQAASVARATYGLCYASAFCGDATAAAQLRTMSGLDAVAPPTRFAAGTRRTPWQRNCVAIGDAATTIEPLEWSNLHLAHSAIDRILAMLPGTDCAPVELSEYNRQAYAEAIRVRDFVLLHYVAARRSEPFWRAAAAIPLPPTLAHTLGLFRERGRLPVYEEETFSRDSWLAVLFGQGELPVRIDPLVEVMPVAQVAQAMADMRGAIDSALSDFPTYAAYRAAQSRYVAL
ncbi:tryptophan 7-halogenase [Sphingomonas sp. RT2P30]|uniref:tryptophan 7-halogenase n=1 Tax=Parasphingomonas halimpatiens TaxID=3096162 RepID=UPI002FCC2FE9